jgi:NADH dehydrogenase FAD-containing subunit
VTVIDRNDYLQHTQGTIKLAHDTELPAVITISYSEIVEGNKNKFQFRQGTLTQLNKDNTIEISTPSGSKEVVPFDYLIIATGFSYEYYIKDESATGINERLAGFKRFYDKCQESKSILVVGSGIAGVEILGELVDKWGDSKKLGICIKGNRFLPHSHPKCHPIAERFFTERKVNIHYNTAYSEGFAEANGYDHVILCKGQTYKSDFMKANFASSVAPSGEIYINDQMQVTDVDPRKQGIAPPVKDNIFCVGDISYSSLNEEKNIHNAFFLVPTAVQNVIDHASGKRPLHSIPSSIPTINMISLGSVYGIRVMNGLVKLDSKLGERKSGFIRHLPQIYRGDEKLIAE